MKLSTPKVNALLNLGVHLELLQTTPARQKPHGLHLQQLIVLLRGTDASREGSAHLAPEASTRQTKLAAMSSRKPSGCIKMRALVLFSGTGSIDRSLEAVGFDVDNLDIDPKCGCTWTCDILNWEAWRDIPPRTYDFIWASPPCTQ